MPRLLPLLAITTVFAAPMAHADEGTCTFQVDGKDILTGPCKITDLDRKGSLAIAAPHGGTAARIVTTGGGVGKAFWNGGASASETDADLGTVVLLGACWVSSKTKLCTTR